MSRNVVNALDGSRPIYLIHRSYQKSNRLRECFGVIESETGSKVSLGVVTNLPSHTEEGAARFLDQFPPDVPRFADPELFTHSEQLGNSRKAEHHDYLRKPIPDKPDAAWIQDVLNTQLRVGANVRLSPTGLVDDSSAVDSLDHFFQWVRIARQLVGSDVMFVNLCLSRRWLADSELRKHLLNSLVESNETHWYVRVRWGVVTPRYGQLRDVDLMRGYRELCSVASAEQKILLLPNTSLFGWVATSWGATGLTTGPAWPEQAYSEQLQIRMKAGTQRVRRQRYFERSLIHTANLGTHLRLLSESGRVACDCIYCTELDADNGSLDPSKWDNDVASLHYLVQVGRLVRLLSTRNSRAQALKEVLRAVAFLSGLTAPLSGENQPNHLAAWEPLLR